MLAWPPRRCSAPDQHRSVLQRHQQGGYSLRHPKGRGLIIPTTTVHLSILEGRLISEIFWVIDLIYSGAFTFEGGALTVAIFRNTTRC
jgi:hypothetical protein